MTVWTLRMVAGVCWLGLLGVAQRATAAEIAPEPTQKSAAGGRVSGQRMERARVTGRAASGRAVRFGVAVPLRNRAEMERMLQAMQDPGSPSYHRWLTPAEFQARFAATEESQAAIERELRAYGLATQRKTDTRMEVTGTAAAVEQAFGTRLDVGRFVSGRETVMAATTLTKPRVMAETGAVVTGLSGRIRMQVFSRRSGAALPQVAATALPESRYGAVGPYWFDDLKQAYRWPSYQVYAGKGTTIAILGTGSYRASDMALYFGHEGLAPPAIREVAVGDGSAFDAASDGSGESALDLQQSGGMAPKAQLVLYNMPDLTDESLLEGLAQIVTDNTADVVSMSFGAPELAYTAAYNGGVDETDLLLAENDLMAQGNAQGITFVASSGDSGALPIPPPRCFEAGANYQCGSMRASVNAPASFPSVTGVGGTNLQTTYGGSSANLNSAYVSEQAYADPLQEDIFYGTPASGAFWGSGGGNSRVFAKPAFQTLVKTGNARLRTVPDVALHMGGCPAAPPWGGSCNPADSSDIEAIGGSFYAVIGTSAAAPEFAGLTALAVERFGTRIGNENYYLYGLAAAQAAGLIKVFRQDIPGFNGLYTSGRREYSRVLGNGTVIGTNFLLAPKVAPAGVPQTATNP